jgi:hypothetical protein
MPLSVLRAKDIQHAPRFQLWTDAICFRDMSKEAANTYLESMCVRNGVLSAWTTLEMACIDVLGIKKLTGKKDESFIQRLSRELVRRGQTPLDLQSGIWQHLNDVVRINRNIFAHSGVNFSDRFPPASLAEEAIAKVREAILDIYARLGKTLPLGSLLINQAVGHNAGEQSVALM